VTAAPATPGDADAMVTPAGIAAHNFGRTRAFGRGKLTNLDAVFDGFARKHARLLMIRAMAHPLLFRLWGTKKTRDSNSAR
jgi:hypothetical protein